MKSPINRRGFLKLLVAAATMIIGAESLQFLLPKATQSQTKTQATNQTTQNQTTHTETYTAISSDYGNSRSTTSAAAVPRSSKVVVVRGASGLDRQALVEKAIELLGGVELLVPSGARVLVKPNVGFYEKEAATDPQITAAVIRVLKRANLSRIVVGESSVRGYDTEHALQATGTRSLAEEAGAEVRNLDKDAVVSVRVSNGLANTSLNVYQTARDSSYVVSVPRLKRHSATVTTVSLKNMMGVLSASEKGRFHQANLSQCIADLNLAVHPNLVIIDGTRAMTGRGPTGGTMVDLNLVIASTDPVAADLVGAAELFKAEGTADFREAANKVEHIQNAGRVGVGVSDWSKIEVVDASVK